MREHRAVTEGKLLEENQVLLPRQTGLSKISPGTERASCIMVNCSVAVSGSHSPFSPLSIFPFPGSTVHGIHLPTVMKVPRSCSVATGLISVRRFTNLPTTSGARRKPRILMWDEKTRPENLQHRQQFKMKTEIPLTEAKE